MQTSSLPSALAQPFVVSRRVASKVMLDLTVYLPGPSEQELEYLIDLYEAICPPDRLVKYKIAELVLWSSIANPMLTMRGRAAAKAGIKHPYFEPSRERVRQGRALEVQFWDGREIDDPDGSWSFNCQRIHLRSKGLFAFARILVPLTTDLDILHKTAKAIADNVELYSGHGGLVFVYDPNLLEDAFDHIYVQARRFWGVDVEHMNRTLPLMREGIKGVNWITLVGQQFASAPEIKEALGFLVMRPEVTIEPCQHGSVLIAGSEPVIGDQHRPDRSLAPYYAVASALRPLFLTHHPDFPSERFVENGNTVGWIRRFIEPSGWR
jgi:hypothetical protein